MLSIGWLQKNEWADSQIRDQLTVDSLELPLFACRTTTRAQWSQCRTTTKAQESSHSVLWHLAGNHPRQAALSPIGALETNSVRYKVIPQRLSQLPHPTTLETENPLSSWPAKKRSLRQITSQCAINSHIASIGNPVRNTFFSGILWQIPKDWKKMGEL